MAPWSSRSRSKPSARRSTPSSAAAVRRRWFNSAFSNRGRRGEEPVVSHANISAVLGTTAKAQPILIYCYHGNASREYAQIFSDFGFSEVYSLDGGYEAWRTRPTASESPMLDVSLQDWLAAQKFPAA